MRSTARTWPAIDRSRAERSLRTSCSTEPSYPRGRGVDAPVCSPRAAGGTRGGPDGDAALQANARFVPISAVSAGVADLRRVIDDARKMRAATGERTVLFIDEIHRFNKAQQDVVLPHVEEGHVVLIGATTENPSFEVISALLSRTRVYTLKPLTDDEVRTIVRRALVDERGLGGAATLGPEAEDLLVNVANGDARVALNALELAWDATAATADGVRAVTSESVRDALQRRTLLYDRAGDHPMFIARRLVILAAEDVGLADPQALVVASAAQQAVHLIGLPEGYFPLAEATVYLALAPKSDSLKTARGRLDEDIETTRADPVPLHLRNAVTGLMRQLGYGKGYRYAHDRPEHFDPEETFVPDAVQGREYYVPTEIGAEARS